MDVIDYPEAVHSFIESNNPEGLIGAASNMSQVVNAEQENLARQAEAAIGDWLDGQNERKSNEHKEFLLGTRARKLPDFR